MKKLIFLICFIITISTILSGCNKEDQMGEYESLVKEFNSKVLNEYPLQNIYFDVYNEGHIRKDTLNHSVTFGEVYQKEKEVLDKFVKYKPYNKKLKELHNDLEGHYIRIFSSVISIGGKSDNDDLMISDEFSEISKSLVNVDRILKKNGIESNIDLSNDYLSKKDAVDKLYYKKYELKDDSDVQKMLNDYYKGLYILDLNDNVFETYEINDYQKALLESFRKFHRKYMEELSEYNYEDKHEQLSHDIEFDFSVARVALYTDRALSSYSDGDIDTMRDQLDVVKENFSKLGKLHKQLDTEYYMYGRSIRVKDE